MGVCLTSACISLAIARLTRSIWKSLQGSPPLPSPSSSLAKPSTAQLGLAATVRPHPKSQSAPGLDPSRAPTIMSSLIWTCHTSPDTYPRHAVTFCPVGAKKSTQKAFSPSFSLPLCLLFYSVSLFPSLTLALSASVTFSLAPQPLAPRKPTCPLPLPFVIQVGQTGTAVGGLRNREKETRL